MPLKQQHSPDALMDPLMGSGILHSEVGQSETDAEGHSSEKRERRKRRQERVIVKYSFSSFQLDIQALSKIQDGATQTIILDLFNVYATHTNANVAPSTQFA